MSDIVSTDGKDPRTDLRYFFISYSLGVGTGNTIQRQLKQTDGLPDRGMNLAAATKILMDKFQIPVVIIAWQEVCYERFDEWMRFLNGIQPAQKEGPVLGLVQGGGEKTEAPKAELKPVPVEPQST